MAKINASSAKKAAFLCFRNPSNSYEKFINKKWEMGMGNGLHVHLY